jgi:hypothetical protein
MAEKKVRVPFPTPTSPVMEGSEVLVAESTERWTDIRLEDGTEMRLKSTVISAIRMDDQFDPDGNPMYLLKANPAVGIINVPDRLRKPAQNPKIQ